MDTKVLNKLTTESINEMTKNIDNVSTLEIVEMINNEDKKVAYEIEQSKHQIASAIDLISKQLCKGGRLFYVGAGTSGRIGILDASECPPTFGVDYETIQGIIAGGTSAIFKAKENSEDIEEEGCKDLKAKNLNKNDVVCGIAASGRTPYVIGALKYAKQIGAPTICVTMNKQSKMEAISDIPIVVVTGPEVIMGSTRMKAGTAQKMILNMLTTGTMIKLGKVYHNLMVDVKVSNEKLSARAKRIIKILTNSSEDDIEKTLIKTNNNVKLTILMLLTNLEIDKASSLLNKNKGYIQKSLNSLDN